MLNMVILSGYYCCERLDKTFSCDDDGDGERTNEKQDNVMLTRKNC